MAPDLPRPQWVGRLEYRWAHRLQRARRAAILQGTAPEALWLLEHPLVVTTGRRSVDGLEGVRAPVVHTERGGLATVHLPGQLVGYLMLDVRGRGGSVKGTVRAVERGIVAWLTEQGVEAGTRDGLPGVWVGTDKICAIGLHFRRGVTMHGFALNLDPDLSPFSWIVPCGITDGGVTSLARIRGASPRPHEAAEDVGGAVLRAFVDTIRVRR